jgi:undecaprenyl-diphosphatase
LESFLAESADLLTEWGPELTFLLAFLETAWLQGFFMPTGPVMIFTAALLAGGGDPWWPVFAAGLIGGGLGDSLHFWIGRRLGPRVASAPGWPGRLAKRHLPRTRALFEDRPAFAVTMARLVSFVRTLMPGVAGAAGLRYRVFIIFDLLGLLGWAALYVGIGVVAGENWDAVSRVVGAGWLILFAVIGLMFWRRTRGPEPA